MAKIRERARDSDVGQGQRIADQVTVVPRDNLLEIVEDRRQLVKLCLLRRVEIAWTAHEARRDDPIEEDLRPATEQQCVRKFLVPDGLTAQLRVRGDQRRLREFGFEIMDDRARIREHIVAVAQCRHLAEWARFEELGRGVWKAGRLQLDLNSLFTAERQHLAHEWRQR